MIECHRKECTHEKCVEYVYIGGIFAAHARSPVALCVGLGKH